MNAEEIIDKVTKINNYSADDQAAHEMEDDLYREFIEYIRDSGTLEQRAMAEEVLKTSDIDFVRWTN